MGTDTFFRYSTGQRIAKVDIRFIRIPFTRSVRKPMMSMQVIVPYPYASPIPPSLFPMSGLVGSDREKRRSEKVAEYVISFSDVADD